MAAPRFLASQNTPALSKLACRSNIIFGGKLSGASTYRQGVEYGNKGRNTSSEIFFEGQRSVKVRAAAAKRRGGRPQAPRRRKGFSGARAPVADPDACPCGSGSPYDGCCGEFHGGAVEPTAVAVMRARFSAYVKKLPEYIVRSTHPDCPLEAEFRQDDGTFGPGFLAEATRFCEGYEFTRLSILQTAERPLEDEATVFFKVWYRIASQKGEQQTMTEKSLFRRVGDRWLYFDRLS